MAPNWVFKDVLPTRTGPLFKEKVGTGVDGAVETGEAVTEEGIGSCFDFFKIGFTCRNK